MAAKKPPSCEKVHYQLRTAASENSSKQNKPSRQGIYCNNLANWVTEIFEVDMTSMMVGRQFKPWAHSRKFVVVT